MWPGYGYGYGYGYGNRAVNNFYRVVVPDDDDDIVCYQDGDTGRVTCVDEDLVRPWSGGEPRCDEACTQVWDPVCAGSLDPSTGLFQFGGPQTYGNACEAVCAARDDDPASVLVVGKGVCPASF